MNRRDFVGNFLAAAPAAILSDRDRTRGQDPLQLSEAVTDYGMQEVADIIHHFKAGDRPGSDQMRRTARILGLLDRHLQETGTLDELERRLHAGEKPPLNTESIAKIWRQYDLYPDMAVLEKLSRIPDADYERARSESLASQNGRLIAELSRRAGLTDVRGPEGRGEHNAEPATAGDCLDCFCRILRIEAALLGAAAVFGCAPCGGAAMGLIAIESIIQYVFQLCRPDDCSNSDLWRCNSFIG